MCPTLFTSITRDEHRSVSWIGHMGLEMIPWPEMWRESVVPEYSWSQLRQGPRLMQGKSGSRLTGIIRIRLFPRLLGSPNAPESLILLRLPTSRNSTMPGHVTMVSAALTSIFHGSSLQASRSSSHRWAHCRMDWSTFFVRSPKLQSD